MNVLFLGNDASRTGAPIALLHLMRWLRTHTDIRCFLLLRRSGGPLQADYAQLGPVVGYDTLHSDRGWLRRIARRLGCRRLFGRNCLSPVEVLYAECNIDLILANTVTCGGMVADLARLGAPVLCYIHELQSVIEDAGPKNFTLLRRHVDRYMTVSGATRENLVFRQRLPAEKVELVYVGIDVGAVVAAEDPLALGRALGVPDNAQVIGGSGYRYHRKGKDLFVQMARRVHEQAPEVHFIWVGGEAGDDEARRFREDIEREGLTTCLHVVNHVDNPFSLYARFDLLAMVSREDPCPLVVLECACLECPTLCFRDAGGAPEFVEPDAGLAVPFLDVEAMAQKALILLGDPAQRQRLGRRAAVKVRGRHDLSVVSPVIWKVMQRTAAQRVSVPDPQG